MVKRDKIIRIHSDLYQWLKEIAERDEISIVQSSRKLVIEQKEEYYKKLKLPKL